MTDGKTQRLRHSGTLNPNPERVADPLFADSEFFDPRDLLQVRYEMVRYTEGASLREAAERFGTSVPTCVRANRAFRDGGLQALIPQRRGTWTHDTPPTRGRPAIWQGPRLFDYCHTGQQSAHGAERPPLAFGGSLP